MPKRSILIVGGIGYLGDFLTDLLNDNLPGTKVTVYDSMLFDKFYLKRGFEFVRGDVRDRVKLKYYLDRADIVVWLAAFVGDGAAAVDGARTLEINREAVKWLAANFSGRIYYTSTCSVYGRNDGILTEESRVNPVSLYGKSKFQSEAALHDSNSVILRLGTLYGISSQFARPRIDLVANKMTLDAFKDKKIRAFGGKQYRPILHVREVGRLIAQDILAEGRATGVFNLASENITLIEIARRIQKLVPDAVVEESELPTEDLRNYSVSWEKAEAYLNFRPQLTLEDGVTEFLDVLRQGRIKDPTDPIYHNHRYFKEFRPYEDEKFPPQPRLQEELRGQQISSVV